MITQPSRDLVQAHLDSGDVCVIITATNSFVTAPIAQEFGIKTLIATEPEHINGEFTGGVSDVPCFREGKIIRLNNWLTSCGWSLDSFADSTFYSDSLNDIPLLDLVKHPVAANPDETLRSHAEHKGWRIISLR
jgi:HAD superfamily hydrolase (TIGR01490 family)